MGKDVGRGKSVIDVSVSRAPSERKNYIVNLSFENKVALVTGAGSGMGLATPKEFAAAGAAVALVDINEPAVRKVAEQLVAGGHKAIAITCDVTDEAQVKSYGRTNRFCIRAPGRRVQQCRRPESCG